jgi:hypothetical protein
MIKPKKSINIHNLRDKICKQKINRDFAYSFWLRGLQFYNILGVLGKLRRLK